MWPNERGTTYRWGQLPIDSETAYVALGWQCASGTARGVDSCVCKLCCRGGRLQEGNMEVKSGGIEWFRFLRAQNPWKESGLLSGTRSAEPSLT